MATELVPGRFEVDLTSVCVRVGAVQLPFRLQNTFEEGPITAHDAAEADLLELQFRAPRKLTGLHGFFAAHGLRPNDRIALVFDDDGLQIEAIRRERGAASKAARSRGARSGGNDGDRLGDRLGAANSAPTGVDGAGPRATAPELPEPAATPGAGAPEASGDEAPRHRARPGANTALEPERKRVVRERIRGNAPPLMTGPDLGAGFEPRTTVTTNSDKDGPASSGSDAVNGLPRWEPLDVMAPPGGWPEAVEGDLREAARAQGHGIVREVRRSRLGTVHALASAADGDAAGTLRVADRTVGAGTQDAVASTALAAEAAMRFSSKAEDRDGLQAKALQHVLDRRSRPRETAAEARGPDAAAGQRGATAAGTWHATAASSTVDRIPAAPEHGGRAQAQAGMPTRPVTTPPAVTRSLNQRPITRTTPTQRGVEPAPTPEDHRGPSHRGPSGLIEGDDGVVQEHVLTGYPAGRPNAAAEPTTPWGPVDRLASVRVGQGGAGTRRSWTAAAQPLLQVTAGLKRNLVPERQGDHDAVTSGAGTDMSTEPHGTRQGHDPDGDGLPHLHDSGAGHDEHEGRGLDLFGLRKRLRRGRNASDARADADGGRSEQEDRRSSRRRGNADKQGIDASQRLGADVLADDEADDESQGAASPAHGRPTDDFSDAFLEFDEESRGAGGSTTGLRDVGNGRTRPWLDNGEYRPTDTSPWQPGGHVAARSPVDADGQQRAAEDEAAHQVAPTVARASAPDEPELPRSTGGRHAATKGYYDLSRLNEATSPRAHAQPPAQPHVSPETAAPKSVSAVNVSGAPATAAEPAGPSSSAARAQPGTVAGSPSASSNDAPSGANDQVVVEGYLARPDVPAIVRSEAMADNIGMPLDRVERVMMRIAEDRERVTRIRPGAYLVRRKPTPKSDDGMIGPTA